MNTNDLTILLQHRLSGSVGTLVTGNIRQRDGRMLFAPVDDDQLWVDPDYLFPAPANTQNKGV